MYADKTIHCRDCGMDFVFSAGEQQFYAEKGLMNEPQRCPSCRAVAKQNRALGIGSGGGYALRFSACNDYNLGHYSYPDFRYVGTAAGAKWNDRISAVFDNQTSGANYASFYNWNGSAWDFKFGPGHQIVFPYVGDSHNDTFDRVDVC